MSVTLLKTPAGSRLYGTSTEKSDEDFKLIFLPDVKDILLGKGESSSHSIKEEDVVSWSFQKWIRLLLKMDSNAYEVLFSNIESISLGFPKFMPDPLKILTDKREPAIGFVDSSMTRYALRGSRLKDFIETVSILSKYKNINDALDELYTVNSLKLYKDPMGVQMISLHGKSFPVPGAINEAIKLFNKHVTNASKRAENSIDSHDWKGIAHGYRIASQMLELIRTGEILFPLQNKETILKMRHGEYDIESAVKMVEDKVQELREEPESSYLIPYRDFDKAYEYGMELVYNLHYEYVKQN